MRSSTTGRSELPVPPDLLDCGPSGSSENSGAWDVWVVWEDDEPVLRPVALTVSPGWPLTAITVPAEGATIWVASASTLSEASLASSLASWALAAATSAVSSATGTALSWASRAWSEEMAALSAVSRLLVAGAYSVARVWPLCTAWPARTGTLAR